MNRDPNNPFNWRLRTEPSIFYKDPVFRAKKDGRSDSERAAAVAEERRSAGFDPVDLYALGSGRQARTKRATNLLSYKQFGTQGKGGAPKKPNKHEK